MFFFKQPHVETNFKWCHLDTIDDVLLPMCGGAVQVVRADDVDGGGGGTALHHVHYVVRVRDVEAARI